MGRVGKKSSTTWTLERDPVTQEERTTYTDKDAFVLNDFYNMLDEEITTAEWVGTGPVATDFAQKVYTMGPGLVLAMRFNSESYNYFQNAHGDVVYFAEKNFAQDGIESYEYDVWGRPSTDAEHNQFLYASQYYDQETGMLIGKRSNYHPEIVAVISTGMHYSNIYLLFRSGNSSAKSTGAGGGIPDKDNAGEDCRNDCQFQLGEELARCQRYYGTWEETCWDIFSSEMEKCWHRGHDIRFGDLDCMWDALDWLETCRSQNQDELNRCEDDAYEVLNDCYASCQE